MNAISKAQLGKSQTLFAQMLKMHALDFSGVDPREARLRWAGNLLQRPVGSFSELTRSEAHRLINALNRNLGLPTRNKPRQSAHDAGTHGRARRKAAHDVLAGQPDFDRIKEGVERLGWDEQHYQRWLQSPSSPLKFPHQVRTLAHANRVWWAIKRMLKKQGRWEQ